MHALNQFSLQEKLGIVVKATRQHARNLASFAFLYKFILFALGYAPRDRRQTEKEGSYNTFVAGLVAGYVVFGRGIQSSVNQQIVIYVFGRVVLALAKLAVQKGQLLPHDASEWLQARSWSIFASFSWAAVMWLFRWHPDSLQPSLRSSMKYMYVWLIVGLAPVLWLADIYSYSNADIWDSFRNFLIYNS